MRTLCRPAVVGAPFRGGGQRHGRFSPEVMLAPPPADPYRFVDFELAYAARAPTTLENLRVNKSLRSPMPRIHSSHWIFPLFPAPPLYQGDAAQNENLPPRDLRPFVLRNLPADDDRKGGVAAAAFLKRPPTADGKVHLRRDYLALVRAVESVLRDNHLQIVDITDVAAARMLLRSVEFFEWVARSPAAADAEVEQACRALSIRLGDSVRFETSQEHFDGLPR